MSVPPASPGQRYPYPVPPQQPVPYPIPPQRPVPPMKKPFWERGWFITLVVILGLVVIGRLVSNGSGGVNTTTTGASAASTAPAAEAGKAAAEAPAPTTEDKPAASAPATEDKPDTITLKATASGDGTVMWMHDGSSNSESFNGEWTKEIPAEHGGWTVSVTGDIFGGDEQTMGCEIIVRGKSEEAKTGSGAAGSAYCSTYIWH